MARKNLLKGLMDEAPTPGPEPEKRPAPRYSKGAVGAVSQSIEALKNRSIVELDPFTIKAGGLSDRLEHNETDHASLMASMQAYGQQVPVLVRPDPDTEGQYLIVYGRRRVAALRDLGVPAKAMIRNLDDREAILAQGQENSARRDLSFIEKANFARQMVETGYERKIIADALSTDKTLISRMLFVADAVPVAVIERIGSAPGIGRDRWTDFAKLWTDQEMEEEDGLLMLATFAGQTSDTQFDGLHRWLSNRLSTSPRSVSVPTDRVSLLTEHGDPLGHFTRRKTHIRLDLKTDGTNDFANWLAENMTKIHRDWKTRSGE